MTMWVLTAHLDDTHNVTKWQSQEGAIANLERLLKPRWIKDTDYPKGHLVWPGGWSAITRQSTHRER